MKYILVVLFVLCYACAKPNKIVYINPAFNSIYLKFEQLYQISPYDININFIDQLENNVVGQCWEWDNGDREIVILKSFWDKYDNDGREQLVFHELGHCLLNRDHDDKIENECPSSIMNSYVFGHTLCYKNNKDYYYQELKNF